MNRLHRLSIGVAMLGCLYPRIALAQDGTYDGMATITSGGPVCESGKVTVKITGSDLVLTRWTKSVFKFTVVWAGDSFKAAGLGELTGTVEGDHLSMNNGELGCSWHVDAHRVH